MDLDKYIISNSQKMFEVKSILKKLSGTNVPLFVFGEHGVGKDLVSQTLHYMSSNRYGPYLKVDFAGASDDLLEEELFGSPDIEISVGKLILAGRGTIVLDDIGEWPHNLQNKLLGVIQEG